MRVQPAQQSTFVFNPAGGTVAMYRPCRTLAAFAAAGLLAGCTHHTTPTAVSTSSARTAAAAAVPASTAAAPSAPTRSRSPGIHATATAGRCAGDRYAARVIAVYTALLKAPLPGTTATPRHLYVQTSASGDNGPGMPSALRPLPAAVLRCLASGLPGWPPVTLVSGWGDPHIATNHRGLIPAITGGGALIVFGTVAATGTTVTSAITVSRGNNNTYGAAYGVNIRGTDITLGRQLSMWIS